MITNWRELKVGQHVRLSCGCEGYVSEVHLEGEEGQLGFVLKFTKGHCGKMSRFGYRNGYSDGNGPYGNFFNYGSQDESCPIEKIPAPIWWQKFEDGPDRKLKNLKNERRKRYVRKAQ